MRKIFYSFILLFTFMPVLVTKAQEKDTLKVMSYNLRFGELATLEELATFIKSENPDVVALQEVDVKTNRPAAKHQNGKDFITELGYLTGMFSLYGKTIPYTGGYYGIGILTKYPYISAERILLNSPEGTKEQRAILISEIELPDNSIITFACTHLDHSTTTVRQAQVEHLNEVLQERNNPIIVCGDFNGHPNADEIKRGMQKWLNVGNETSTFPAKNPRSTIDYIFCYPENRWNVLDFWVPQVQLSDHLPIVSTLTLNKE